MEKKFDVVLLSPVLYLGACLMKPWETLAIGVTERVRKSDVSPAMDRPLERESITQWITMKRLSSNNILFVFVAGASDDQG